MYNVYYILKNILCCLPKNGQLHKLTDRVSYACSYVRMCVCVPSVRLATEHKTIMNMYIYNTYMYNNVTARSQTRRSVASCTIVCMCAVRVRQRIFTYVRPSPGPWPAAAFWTERSHIHVQAMFAHIDTHSRQSVARSRSQCAHRTHT